MSQNALQIEIVEMIFTKLGLVYGRDFLSRWEGLDLVDVKNDWAHELAGVSVDSVRYALKNLPSMKAPTVLEFRNLTRNAPLPVFTRIEAPKANPDVVKAALEKARASLGMKAQGARA